MPTSTKISAHEVTVYREKFTAESSPDGKALPMTKVCSLMREMGWTAELYPDDTLLGWFSPSDEQTLDFDGFLTGIQSNPSSKRILRARATRFYNGCDADKNGGLTKDELKKLFAHDEDGGMDDDMCKMVMDFADKNGDNLMQINELFTVLNCADKDLE